MDNAKVRSKPYIQYDPTIGYRYIPNAEMELASPDGSNYVIRINSAGIRSDREYSEKKPNGVFRVLVFGDSMAAGQHVNNNERFTERLEMLLPNTEFINFGLEGTGTDQQFLIFRQYASMFEYDAVLLCPFVENIRRNMVRYRLSVDLKSERWILTPKPRFEQNPDGSWNWTGIPVSKHRIFHDEATPDILKDTDFGGSDVSRGIKNKLRAAVNRFFERTKIKGCLYSMIEYEPYGEYKDPSSQSWRTMTAILAEFKKITKEKKFIIAPLVYSSYVKYNLANAYKNRFSEECCYFLDILPQLKDLSPEDQENCFISNDCHFSPFGHQKIALAIMDGFERSGILKE